MDDGPVATGRKVAKPNEGAEHQIYIISLPEADGVCYFEGVSGKLAAEPGELNGWFCFEEPFGLGAYYLSRMGFTQGQIEAAIEVVDDGDRSDYMMADEAYDVRGFGGSMEEGGEI